MEHLTEHIGRLISYKFLLSGPFTDTGDMMKGSGVKVNDLCPLVVKAILFKVNTRKGYIMTNSVCSMQTQKCCVSINTAELIITAKYDV